MTPKELEKIREGYWGLVGSEQESKFRLLFTHIDTQAAQISDLMTNCNSLRNRCWKAAAQIKALKEKLVEERAKQFDVDEPCIGRTHFEFCELMDGSCDGYPHMWEACPRKKEKLEEARQQLKAEMPEVGWE